MPGRVPWRVQDKNRARFLVKKFMTNSENIPDLYFFVPIEFEEENKIFMNYSTFFKTLNHSCRDLEFCVIICQTPWLVQDLCITREPVPQEGA